MRKFKIKYSDRKMVFVEVSEEVYAVLQFTIRKQTKGTPKIRKKKIY